MLQISGCYKNSTGRLSMLLVLVALIALMASCNKSEKTTAEKPAQKTFATPAEAGAALLQAAKSGDQTALMEVFGPDRVMFGGDWPVCTLRSSFQRWVDALDTITADKSDGERKKLFHDNAVRFYGLRAEGKPWHAKAAS